MTEKTYLTDSALTGEATIVEIFPSEMVVRIDKTLFHAQGGGQPSDQGTLGGSRVLRAVHNGNDVDHHVDNLAGLKIGEKVAILVDSDRRHLNARYHSAGHLIACVVEHLFPNVKALQGHQWPGEARVEFGGHLPQKSEIELSLQDAVNSSIKADLPIIICGDPYASRSIKIGDFAAIPCGGTHAKSTSELGAIKIKGCKLKGDKLRVSYELE